jgi:hypothetical protein
MCFWCALGQLFWRMCFRITRYGKCRQPCEVPNRVKWCSAWGNTYTLPLYLKEAVIFPWRRGVRIHFDDPSVIGVSSIRYKKDIMCTPKRQ